MNLFELSRSQLVSVIRDQTPTRFNSRLKIQLGTGLKLDPDLLVRSGLLNVKVPVVGETDEYLVSIEIDDYLRDLVYSVQRSVPSERRNTIVQSLRYAFQMYDMKVHCTCPDFHYRFEYTANQKGALVIPPGDANILPAKITNPDNNGVGCKHIGYVVANYSRWVPKLVTQLNRTLKNNPSLLSR
ncbi:hypothetical protein SP15_038 [Bacillus phage SP-15]|uniref:SWIM-type domain-containing protein n=1 Tax=Bacillus phage SP-15 TaxID=1792032 RepID=A0A127AW82_9CAUD|nr:hypothetical protein SP15_038 [Bacillus phage SP-15]AMM44837.1 hypothetical protein SP15_038 [Bacillus phage SP-15]